MKAEGNAAATPVSALYKTYGFIIARRLAALGVPQQRGSVARVFHSAGAELSDDTAAAPTLLDLLAALAQCCVRDTHKEPYSRRDADAFAITYLRRVEGLDEEAVHAWIGISGKRQRAALLHFERLERDGAIPVPHPLDTAWAGARRPQGGLTDLELERHLIGDLPPERSDAVEQALRASPDQQGRFDRLLKQRLIFLADNPPERLIDALAALGPRPLPSRPPRRWTGRSAALPAAGAAVIALVATALVLQEAPRAGGSSALESHVVDAAPAATPEAVSPIPEPLAEPAAAPTPPAQSPAPPPAATAVALAPAPNSPRSPPTRTDTSAPPVTRRPSAEARLLLYAREGKQRRSLEEGDAVGPGERIVPWVELEQDGWIGLLSLRDDGSVRVYVTDDGYAVETAADGPTRLSGARSLLATDDATRETLMLLYASERFPVRPIAERLRRGDRSRLEKFAGSVSHLSVRLPPADPVGGQ